MRVLKYLEKTDRGVSSQFASRKGTKNGHWGEKFKRMIFKMASAFFGSLLEPLIFGTGAHFSSFFPPSSSQDTFCVVLLFTTYDETFPVLME